MGAETDKTIIIKKKKKTTTVFWSAILNTSGAGMEHDIIKPVFLDPRCWPLHLYIGPPVECRMQFVPSDCKYYQHQQKV